MKKGPRVLITGSKGFVGKHLVTALKKKSYSIFEFDMDEGDVANVDFCLHFTGIDHVIHLAAKTFVPESWKNPYSYYHTNFMGTLNILEFCKRQACSLTFLNTYTYGVPRYLPIDENHIIKPNTPYNSSKMFAENLCEFYYENMGVDITVLRVFNVFGPRQKNEFLLPEIINQALDSDKETIEVNDLKPKRDYLYIEDLLLAIEKTIEKTKGYNVYNIGSGCSYSVGEIVDLVQDYIGVHKKVVSKEIIRKNEIEDVYADISNAKKRLGFSPSHSIEEGIALTVEAMINSED